MTAQEYSELLCVRDKFWSERLTLAIGLDREPTGLLFQALNDQTKPLRRYFAVRMLLCMASEYPEARALHLLCATACLRLDHRAQAQALPASVIAVQHADGSRNPQVMVNRTVI